MDSNKDLRGAFEQLPKLVNMNQLVGISNKFSNVRFLHTLPLPYAHKRTPVITQNLPQRAFSENHPLMKAGARDSLGVEPRGHYEEVPVRSAIV